MSDAGAIPLVPGTAIHLPPNTWHSAEFTADTVLMEFNLVEPRGIEPLTS